MIKKCPYCSRALDLTDASRSGHYVCPYDDCSTTFFYDKDENTLHKIEELAEEMETDKIIIECPNLNCRQELRLPKISKELQVTCPRCKTSFRYHPQGQEPQQDIGGLLAEFDKALEDEIK